MRIEWAFACRAFWIEDGRASAHEIGLDTLVVPVPARVQIPILGRLAAREDESGSTHSCGCRLTGPELEPIGTRDLDVVVTQPGPEHPAGWEVRGFLPIGLRFDADRVGTYGLDLSIDGRFRWQVPFRVLAA